MKNKVSGTYDSVLSIRLAETDNEKLDRWAKAIHFSKGDVMRVLLDKWFAHEVSVVQSDKGLK